ncbi:hypothetical protein QZH41_014925, partial [Actinostola sp. cb2023]
EEAGGKCLPCVVDIRDEKAVIDAVEKGVAQFGGIDILVNNASAISLTGTSETPMKRYDLMNSVNGRGTYLCSQACLPYLKKGNNPHILNISPPLNMNPVWFKNHVAYTMAKYGMSMCVLGMAEEFKDDGIAVNALWPRTAIATAAMKMLGGEDVVKQCRTVDIMADAAYVVLTRDSRSYTGQFFIDDDVLNDVGVSDLENYSCVPGEYTGSPLQPNKVPYPRPNISHTLFRTCKSFITDYDNTGVPIPDPKWYPVPAAYFFPTSSWTRPTPEKLLKDHINMSKLEGGGGIPAGSVAKLFDTIKSLCDEQLVKDINGVFEFDVSGTDAGFWYLDLKKGSGSAGAGSYPDGQAQCTMLMDCEDFVKMFRGQLNPTQAFMSGKLQIKGDMMIAMKLEKLMGKMKSKL